LHERTDAPVFTIEEAVAQVKDPDPTRVAAEKDMDQFFLRHLADNILEKDVDLQPNDFG
jgi:hypothetical protein